MVGVYFWVYDSVCVLKSVDICVCLSVCVWGGAVREYGFMWGKNNACADINMNLCGKHS